MTVEPGKSQVCWLSLGSPDHQPRSRQGAQVHIPHQKKGAFNFKVLKITHKSVHMDSMVLNYWVCPIKLNNPMPLIDSEGRSIFSNALAEAAAFCKMLSRTV